LKPYFLFILLFSSILSHQPFSASASAILHGKSRFASRAEKERTVCTIPVTQALIRLSETKRTAQYCTFSASKRKINDFSDAEAEFGYLNSFLYFYQTTAGLAGIMAAGTWPTSRDTFL
jgi:hypothetical protein